MISLREIRIQVRGHPPRYAVVMALRRLLGRRRFVRLARYLLDQARLDLPNDLQRNGELMVQSIAARSLGLAGQVVVFDVGANIGQWSSALIETMRCEGRSGFELTAFEPSAKAHSELVRIFEGTDTPGSARAIRAALSNQTGVGQLYKPHEGAGSSSLHEDDRFDYESEQVHLTTLDDFCESTGTRHIHLLKVDAEGHDFAVLEGAFALLRRHAIDLIQFEYNFRWIFAGHYLRDAFVLFGSADYGIGKITPVGIEFYEQWHEELETFREANYLACRRSYADLFPKVTWWNM